jgi:hypothetical protein
MAKYYVQSGTVRTVVAADDQEKAALWTVHKTMQQVVPVYDDQELSAEEKGDVALARGIMVLGNTIQVSERGFDRPDADQLDTFDLICHWHQLMMALAKLDDLLGTSASKSSQASRS